MIEISRFKNSLFFLWVLMLIFLTGMLNIYSIKHFGMTVSHHTGNISNFAFGLYQNKNLSLNFFYVIAAFFAGGVIAGWILHDEDPEFEDNYGIISIIFGIIVISLNSIDHYFVKLYSLVLMLGFQNGIFKKFNKVIIRTSHFTGYLTDAGIVFGKVLRGNFKDLDKLIIYISSILSFIVGGFFSGYIIDKNFECLLVIGCFYLIAGLYYMVIRNACFRQNKSSEDVISMVENLNEGVSFEENI